MTDTFSLDNLQSGSIIFIEDSQSLVGAKFKIINLTDVDIADLNHGSGTVKFLGVGAGSSTVTFQDTTFTGLTDTPSSYSGQGGKAVKVNSGETGLEFGSFNVSQLKIGTFTRDVSLSSGTQAITGVGFQPDVCIFFSALPSGGFFASWGLDDGSNPYMLSITSYDGVMNTSAGRSILYDNGANVYGGHINSMDADGFTIYWQKEQSPTGTLEVIYLAIKA